MTEHLPELVPLDGLGKAVVYEAFDSHIACKEEGEGAERFGLSEKRVEGIALLVQVKPSKVRFMGYPFC